MARSNKPKLYEQPRLCGGKRQYAHKHEAEQVKTEQEIINPELELSIYKCMTCGAWHLTRSLGNREGQNLKDY